jgi:carbamoyltransferase
VEAILRELIDLREDGSFRLRLEHFAFHEGERMTAPSFARLFGIPARTPEAPVTQEHCDLARSIQEVIERIVLLMARSLHAETGETRLCLAGGVALNCVANGRLLREGPFKELWIQPAAGDAGGALGAALAYYFSLRATPPRAPGGRDAMQGAFLGPDYTDESIRACLSGRGLPSEQLADAGAAARRTAEALAAGKVVGVVQGRAEFGPRALGSRSILADPRRQDMQSQLNLKIKFRESFRPFAPIVLAEQAADYFELGTASPYMLLTAPVTEKRRQASLAGTPGLLERLHEQRSDIPAVTHVDYSARVQTVEAADNPWLHAVLRAFRDLTGCPVLINTSFNVRGEPPVCAPGEAIDGFLATGMDCLCLGTHFLDKATLPPSATKLSSNRNFQPD